jgi:ribosomal protein L11 methylase PrmA
MALAPRVRRRLRRDGIAILSGILDHQTREVCATYRVAGFRLRQRCSRDGWTALMLATV